MQKLFHFQIGECRLQVEPFAAEGVEVHVARQGRQTLSRTPHGITDFFGILHTEGGFEVQVIDEVRTTGLTGTPHEALL